MVADLAKQDKMADVTIYGMECNFCEDEFESIDQLVRHLVNDHDDLWDYKKTYENALKRIKIDEKLGKFTMVSKPSRFIAVKTAQDAHYCLSIYI